MKSIARNTLHNKLTSVINVVGLSIALASAIVLTFWITEELSYNKQFTNNEGIYQVIMHVRINDQTESYRSISYPIITKLNELASVKEVVHLTSPLESVAMQYKDNQKLYPLGKMVSPNFFSGFDNRFLYGNPSEALAGPSSIVITESLANKLFGKNWISLVDKAILSLGNRQIQIGGVIEDFPANTTVRFDFCMRNEPSLEEHIGSINYETYVVVEKSADMIGIQDAVNSYLKEKIQATISFQNITEVYLYSNFKDGKPDGGRITYVKLFGLATLFIIVMSAINFTNLFTANSLKRIKEIGMRKVMGANRTSLMFQLLSEALFITFFAMAIALISIYFLLPEINSSLKSNILLPWSDGMFWFFVITLCIIIGILAGIYPAIFLTGLNPSQFLKSHGNFKVGGIGVRNVLFGLQFFISLLLTNFTFGVTEQIQLLMNKDLGYDRDALLVKALSSDELNKIDVIKEQLKKSTAFSSVSVSGSDLISGVPMTSDVIWQNKQPGDSSRFGVLFVDADFIETMKIKTIVGELPKYSPPGLINVVVNETAMGLMGERKLIGEIINVWGTDVKVTGLIEDFNFNSLFTQVQPLILVDLPEESEYLICRVNHGDEPQAIEVLSEVHKDYNQGDIFHFEWMEDRIASLYENESLTGVLAKIFSVIIVVITIMGFFGLSNFAFKQKTKEISIRKVLGAPYKSIVSVLFWDFFKLIFIAAALALPVSYILIQQWVEKFAYRIDLSMNIFFTPLVALLIVSVLTALYHSVKAYVLNPVFFLRED
ncbi:MAG: FtsX-like permease family protein [Cyclobacteriaceae bacterium]|nr:FtsX-like permease family protein [Cyclobacteriaceae bacterium]